MFVGADNEEHCFSITKRYLHNIYTTNCCFVQDWRKVIRQGDFQHKNTPYDGTGDLASGRSSANKIPLNQLV
jgi:hypothetical protein